MHTYGIFLQALLEHNTQRGQGRGARDGVATKRAEEPEAKVNVTREKQAQLHFSNSMPFAKADAILGDVITALTGNPFPMGCLEHHVSQVKYVI